MYYVMISHHYYWFVDTYYACVQKHLLQLWIIFMEDHHLMACYHHFNKFTSQIFSNNKIIIITIFVSGSVRAYSNPLHLNTHHVCMNVLYVYVVRATCVSQTLNTSNAITHFNVQPPLGLTSHNFLFSSSHPPQNEWYCSNVWLSGAV